MNQPTKAWVEQIQAHLELTEQICRKLPANERLEAKDLNRILELFDLAKSNFLLMCELNGFKTESQPPNK